MARNGRKNFTKNEKFKVQKRKISQKINSSLSHPSTSVSESSHSPSSNTSASQKTHGHENKSNGLYIEQRHNRDSVYVVRDRTDARQLCRVYAKEVIEEAREEIELIHNLTRSEDRHPRLTPIKELRAVENGCAIFYQSNCGNLKELVEENKMLTELQAAVYFKQIVETINYCHTKNVTLGRNIKLMNCVFDDNSFKSIRLDMLENPIDISISKETSDRHFHPAYCPPEAIPWWGDYDAASADSWTLGILLYRMVAGRYPYMDPNIDKQYYRITLQPIPMPDFLSDSLKSLLYMLLQKDWTKRISIQDILYHPWCKTSQNILVPKHSIFT